MEEARKVFSWKIEGEDTEQGRNLILKVLSYSHDYSSSCKLLHRLSKGHRKLVKSADKVALEEKEIVEI